MMKKTITLGLLGCVLLLTGCSNTHPIDDTPNYGTSCLKQATIIYHYRDQDVFRNIESYYYHNSCHRDRIIGFPSDAH